MNPPTSPPSLLPKIDPAEPLMTASLRLESHDEKTPEWSAAREECRAGVHLMDPWIAYRASRGLAPKFLLLREGGGPVVGVGIAYESRSRWRLWKRPQWSLDRLPWPVGEFDLSADDAVHCLREAAQQGRLDRLEVQSFDGPSPCADLAALGFSVQDRFEFELDLSGDEDELWSRLKSSHRRKIRKAQKSGVEVAWEDSSRGIELLRELQGHTQTRRSDKGETMDCPDAEQYQALARTFLAPNGGRVLVGRHEGKPVTAILLGVTANRAYYLMGGTNREGLGLNSASVVMWEAVRALHETKIPLLNLGGVPARAENPDSAEHGLYRFKDGWGATRCLCRSGTWTRGSGADSH